MKIKRRPAFFIAVALSLGILIGHILIEQNLIFVLQCIIIIVVSYFFYFLFYKLKLSKKRVYIFLVISFFLLGIFLIIYQEYKYKSEISVLNFAGKERAEIVAEVDIDIGDLESEKVYLKPHLINGTKVKYGKILLNSAQIKNLKAGDLISLNLDLSLPASALNPGSFSYRNYLKKERVYLQGWKAQNIKILKQNYTFKNLIIRVKKRFLNNIDYLFTAEKAAFIKAILLGEREYLSYEQQNLLKKAGASHLLAISGLHMGIIILTFSFILFNFCSNRKNALYFLSFLTFIYVIIVGAAVSIIRASLLALLFLWSDEFNREGDFLNILSFTLIINLLFEPLALFTVSLQLSYLLVFTLFYLTPLLNKLFPPILAVSLAAQLGSLPIIAYYFNEYAWIALITNLWLIPYITLLLPLIFILLLLSLLNLYFFQPFTIIIEIGINFLFKALRLMETIQSRPLVIVEPEIIIVVFYYLILFSLPFIYQKRYIYIKAKKYLFWQKLLPLILIFILISLFITPTADKLIISFVAVGQGDGIFIQFPGGKNMLIDTGPPGRDGRNIEYSIISYLNYLGVAELDYLMISHFDSDHAGGIPHLLQRKEIKNIFIPPFREKTEIHNYLEAEFKNYNFSLNYLTEGKTLKVSDCRIDILNPAKDNLSPDRNENSIVFLLTQKQKKFLFTGDLSKVGEEKIVEKYNLGKIDILKAGHHGSKTSSGEILLDAVNPNLAVISVGRNNFGHPSAEVIKRFESKSINYLRTDQRGLIKVISNGENISVSSFR